jgi:hypothetical protein
MSAADASNFLTVVGVSRHESTAGWRVVSAMLFQKLQAKQHGQRQACKKDRKRCPPEDRQSARAYAGPVIVHLPSPWDVVRRRPVMDIAVARISRPFIPDMIGY